MPPSFIKHYTRYLKLILNFLFLDVLTKKYKNIFSGVTLHNVGTALTTDL